MNVTISYGNERADLRTSSTLALHGIVAIDKGFCLQYTSHSSFLEPHIFFLKKKRMGGIEKSTNVLYNSI